MKNMTKTSREQMELGFAQGGARRRGERRRRGLPRARWWFTQMRRAVDEAGAWHTDLPSRAEQTQLRLAGRN
ncbi:MAG TPA: hypothetical protein VI454_01540 [Verrucomicrobiae bacterium]|jgi:hypothetical protein